MITLHTVYPVQSALSKPIVYKTNSTNEFAGQVRYNFNLNQMEIFDGNSWQAYKFDLALSLDPNTIDVINWAHEQRAEHKRMQELCKNYPVIADLKNKLDVMMALVKEKEDA